MLFIGLTLLGYVSYNQLSLELLPNVEQPYLYVQARVSQETDPEYIENEVIIPLEGAIGSLEGIESLESSITSSSGQVTVYYMSDVDANLAYLKLQEKINEVEGSLPDGVTVSVNRVNSNQMSSQFMTLQARGSEGTDRIRNVIEEEVVNDLENIDGIAGVTVYGGQEKAVEIILDEAACEAYNITTSTIRSLLSSNAVSRSYVGNLHESDKLYFVHVTAEYSSVSEIENIVVADGPILLKDIAKIRFGVQDVTSYSRVNGLESVSIQLVNDSQANQIDLSHKVAEVIGTLNEKLRSQDVELFIQENSAESMEENINQIINLALVGGAMAVFVLWVFLKNIRIVAFIALGIPISVFIAFNFFYAYDITLNSLTLVGMALAIGMLLDNSVVVLENIYRLAGEGVDPDTSVTQGTSEVWRSIVAATLTTVTVFLPFLFSSDYLIEMLGVNVGVSIISTLIVSLFVALLFVPMTIHFLLKRKKGSGIAFQKVSTENRMVQVYLVLLKTCMRNPVVTIMGAVVVFFLTVVIALAISTSSLTEVESDQINIRVEMPTGTSLEKTDELVRSLEAQLENVAEKEDVTANVQEGQATLTVSLVEDFEDVNDRSFAEIKSSISEMTNGFRRSADFDVSSSATTSGSAAGGLGGGMSGNFMALLGIGSESETIEIKGEDFDVMRSVAEDLEYYIEDLDFIESVRTSVSSNQPEVHMIFDQLLMTENDIDISNVSTEMNSFSSEVSSGVMFQDGLDEYEIMISMEGADDAEDEEDEARTMDDLKVVQVSDAEGGLHDLQDFTQLVYTEGTSSIDRVNQEKIVEITYTLDSDAQESNDLLEQYRMEIDELVESYAFPSGIAVEVIHETDDLNEFYFLIVAAIILIFMIMASVFESVATPFVLLFSIPLAAIGSLIALIITGNSLLSANTLIGFLILLGIVVNNGIILIDYTNILRGRGYRRTRALMTAGLSRVRPILITAMTTIVAMIPLGMGDAEYVSVIGAPFAIVVIGGLALSTLLTLIFIPTFYSGLESSIEWFNSLSWKLRIFQMALIVFFLFYIYTNVADLVWQMADTVLAVVLVPGATWFVLNSLKKAGTKLIGEDETVHISVQNLVKIYDRPSRFSREWNSGINIQKRLGMAKEFHSLKEFDQLIWQLPLWFFLIYFTFFYLDQSLWISIMMMVVYLYTRFIWKPITLYWDHLAETKQKKFYSFLSKKSNAFLFWFLPLIELVLLFMITNYTGLVIFYAVVWYLGIQVSVTSKRLYEENVNINRISGRFGGLKRGIYRLVKQIPIIGKRRVPFRANDGVSFEIGTGMFGLLGPNGAGKSTMMRTICGILEQSYGKIYINGIDTQEKREELQGLIGYLPQAFGMYENMSAYDYLDYQGILKGLTDKEVREERIEKVLRSVHMWDRKDDKIGSFSGGMKQRIGIGQILLHLPRILVVDEPTAGLDPRERIRFRNLLVELSRDRIVIFSTHIIEDIASSCNQVGVIIRGRVKYHGNPIDMVDIAENLVWQYDVPKNEFEEMPNKQMVTHHMNVGDKIRVRILSKDKPAPDAEKVKPLLEDAYLCLIKDLK